MDLFRTNGSSPPSLDLCVHCGWTGGGHHPRYPTLECFSPDFVVSTHGSLCLLDPLTDHARTWIAEHLPVDAMRVGSAVLVERRDIAAIVAGIQGDGMRVR